MTFGYIAVGIGLTVAAGASVYTANKEGKIANSELSLQADQQAKQDEAFKQLQDLISNPGAFFDSPVYKASFDQGTKAVTRGTAAASGGGPSGAQLTALQGFGQSFGQQQLFSQEQLLAGMSGTGFNPAGAGQAASGAVQAQGASLNSLAGLLSFFGSSGMGSGGGGGGGGNWSLPGGGSFDGSGGGIGYTGPDTIPGYS